VERLLDSVEDPNDLKSLSLEQLDELARELRQEIIDTVALRGGHLAPNLGTVELTLALHVVFDAPNDRLVWDIGHQAYAHKLITGRRDRFKTIKQFEGLAGYLRRDESPFDAFGASHASTSISAALGMAVARDLRGENYHVVAIIGDGALTGGMALEAINNAGAQNRNLIVVVNDNGKSISDNVGALHDYLGRLRTNRGVRRLRVLLGDGLDGLPGGGFAREVTQRAVRSAREFLLPSKSGVIFAELGFTFLGPYDGHDTARLIEVFRAARDLNGPVLIQVVTQKGRGWEFAEADPTSFHGPGPYDPVTGALTKKVGAPPNYQDVFGQTLVDLAREDERIVGITAAMAEGTSLSKLRTALPERYFDVGIAEQHAVTFAAGLACDGMRPVVAVYSTFLQRAFDQVIHDVCVQDLPVVFCLDRAGLVGEDGPTQHGAFDIAYMRLLPNMHVMAPKDENELRHMLYTALAMHAPVCIRYPRGSGVGVALDDHLQALPVGKAELLTSADDIEGAHVAILAYGSMVQIGRQAVARLAEEGIRAVLVNARWAKPLDEALILRVARATSRMLTVEDGSAAGGFGSAVGELLLANGMQDVRLRVLGLPDEFVQHGPVGVLRDLCGLSVEGLTQAAQALVAETRTEAERLDGVVLKV
jgi:1-deoxy-D-xylulose-5-phosphate synthase